MAVPTKYGKWVDLGPNATPKVDAGVRVLCIPQAGMGAWCFHGWQEKAKGVEILPIELPGRNSRMAEPKPVSMEACVRGLVDGVASFLTTPYVVLGHSLGALMAFEAVCEIQRRRLKKPLALIVSGCRAASLSGPDHDVDRIAPELADLPYDQFWSHFERRYGKNPDLQSDLVKRYVEPLLRSDFRLLESYTPSMATPIDVPILACAANGDNRVTPDQLSAWKSHTSAAFDLRFFDVTPLPWSTPHRFLVESPDAFIAFLSDYCASMVAGGAT